MRTELKGFRGVWCKYGEELIEESGNNLERRVKIHLRRRQHLQFVNTKAVPVT